MAHVDIVHTGSGHILFYNVDAAVGRGGQNLRADVLLVQYLLKEGLKSPRFAYIPGDYMPGTPQEGTLDRMILTGSWDEPWDLALLNYQNQVAHNRGGHIKKDGRVDPVIAGQPVGSISHTQYTILYLNMGFGWSRPADLPRLADVADCPSELRTSLRLKFTVPS